MGSAGTSNDKKLIDYTKQDTREVRTLGELVYYVSHKYATRSALHVNHGKGFETYTYSQFYEKVKGFVAALNSLGLKKGDRLAIFSENCIEWGLSDWAAQTLGIIVVPIYPTLPADQVEYIVKDSGAKVLFAGNAILADRAKGVKDLKIVLFNSKDEKETIHSIIQSTQLDEKSWLNGILSVDPDDTATIIYTSGTTGNPKGVILTHKSCLCNMNSIRETIPISETDVFLSFLPLSHVYERVGGHMLPIYLGASIGYVQKISTFASDMMAVNPTVMLCVPRFLDAMRHRIVENISKQSPLKQKLFNWAYQQGLAQEQGKFAPFAGVLDGLVGKKIRERTGGRLRFFVSGGAALPDHVAKFYTAFKMPIIQGYGLTETSAIVSANHPDRNRPETVGEPIPGIELKIAEDGEILVRGPGIMKGYYNLPEATAEAIDSDGWFHTGDIGKMDGKSLLITDRKKDLLVLGNGKNVAPQPIENKIKESDYIEEAVLFGDGMEYVCALIIPNFERLNSFASENNIDSTDRAKLIESPEVKQLFKKEIQKINSNLASFEKVKKYELLENSFTVESGELTPSMKVKRKVVKEKYANIIQKMER